MVAILFPSRHKSLALLTGVLLAQVLLRALQIKRDSRGRLIRVWAVSGASPFERGAAWGFGRVRGVWNHYFALQNTSRENEALRVENDALKLTISQLQSRASEADRLGAVLYFLVTRHEDHHPGGGGPGGRARGACVIFGKPPQEVPMGGARVRGGSAGTASRTIEIDRGDRDGIR